MTPTDLADYIADNLPATQPEIAEFTARLSTRINALSDEVKQIIDRELLSVGLDAKPACRQLHPPAPTP